jgi:hypothetical protein
VVVVPAVNVDLKISAARSISSKKVSISLLLPAIQKIFLINGKKTKGFRQCAVTEY